MVAYRRFQRFDYIIKGRNCDWFQSIAVLACITKQANGSFFLLPSSRASSSFCAPVMQAIPVWSNECSSFDITIQNGFFSFHTILNNKTFKQKRFHGWCDMKERYGVHLQTKIIENKRQFEVQKLDYPCRNLVIWIWNRNERSRNRIIRTWSYFEQVETIQGKLDIADVEVQITIIQLKCKLHDLNFNSPSPL